MVDALAKVVRTTEALSLVEVMTRRDLKPDLITFEKKMKNHFFTSLWK